MVGGQTNEIRHRTSPRLQCPTCGARLAIGQAGFICPNGCGRIMPPVVLGLGESLVELRRAWPELVIGHTGHFHR